MEFNCHILNDAVLGLKLSDTELRRLEDVCCGEYVEYSTDKAWILFGDWNCPVDDSVGWDKMIGRLEDVAELEWADEWEVCGGCGRYVRVSGNSYDWQPYWALDRGEIICGDCVKENPGEYVEGLIGNSSRCVTIDGLDLEGLGFVEYQGGYESGWHPGQDDKPADVAEKLKRERPGLEYVFKLDYNSQFSQGFSVWTRKRGGE